MRFATGFCASLASSSALISARAGRAIQAASKAKAADLHSRFMGEPFERPIRPTKSESERQPRLRPAFYRNAPMVDNGLADRSALACPSARDRAPSRHTLKRLMEEDEL